MDGFGFIWSCRILDCPWRFVTLRYESQINRTFQRPPGSADSFVRGGAIARSRKRSPRVQRQYPCPESGPTQCETDYKFGIELRAALRRAIRFDE